MVTEILFIGDEVTAAGFRLAGIRTIIPDKLKLPEILSELSAQAAMILITSDYMQSLDHQLQQHYLMKVSPMFLVIADLNDRVPAADLAAQVRQTLGMLA